mmetsp:Transcript_4114/g.3710  ORF Transcript_4114/g.3710 Transcript_4114/m.3710 type:complete len:90 (+) Transcript_4114:3-272(+)
MRLASPLSNTTTLREGQGLPEASLAKASDDTATKTFFRVHPAQQRQYPLSIISNPTKSRYHHHHRRHPLTFFCHCATNPSGVTQLNIAD